jgi:hypothetical protein
MKLTKEQSQKLLRERGIGGPKLATNAGSYLAQFAGPDGVSVGSGARTLAGTELRPVHLSQTRRGVSSAA